MVSVSVWQERAREPGQQEWGMKYKRLGRRSRAWALNPAQALRLLSCWQGEITENFLGQPWSKLHFTMIRSALLQEKTRRGIDSGGKENRQNILATMRNYRPELKEKSKTKKRNLNERHCIGSIKRTSRLIQCGLGSQRQTLVHQGTQTCQCA